MGRSLLASVMLFAFLGQAAVGEEACSQDRLDVRTKNGDLTFSVEIADDDAERAQGLMFREELGKDAGMLFVYPRPRLVSFWMKNTLIPLDIIFVDRKGRVRQIHANAQPGDLNPKTSGPNILAVLEINGGFARMLGIAPGSVLRHPAFDPSVAIWPC